MLLLLTKMNCVASNDKKAYVNDQLIVYFHAFSKHDNEGSEIHLTNGTTIRVRETPQEISIMMMTEVKECRGPIKIALERADVKLEVLNEKVKKVSEHEYIS